VVKRNVILITIDTLRADHLNCYGYSKNITKNLDRLASRGALFLHTISNGPYTSPSFISLFSSDYPSRFLEEVEDIGEQNPCQFLSENRVSFVDILKGEGYSTAAFVDSNPYISSYYGYDRSFDMFEDFLNLSRSRGSNKALTFKTPLKRPKNLPVRYGFNRNLQRIVRAVKYNISHKKSIQGAEKVNKRVISWIETLSGGFFLWIHYMDVHGPYIPHGQYLKFLQWTISRARYRHLERGGMPESSLKLLTDLYDEELRYVDQAIGNLIDSLEKQGFLDNTFIILCADHGEEFGEHGSWGLHQSKLYDELLHVPLIITGPGIPKREIYSQTELLDIAPTILDLLNIPKSDVFQGRSLVPLLKGLEDEKTTSVTSEYLSENKRGISFRTNEWKYIVTLGYATGQIIHEELYDLLSDPLEATNLVNIENQKIEKLRARLSCHLAVEEAYAGKYEKAKIRRKIKRLKELGRI